MSNFEINKQRSVILLAISILLLLITMSCILLGSKDSVTPTAISTPTPTPIRFSIEGVEMTISEVYTTNSYADRKPSSDTDTFLIVSAEIYSIPDAIDISDIDFQTSASLVGDWGREDKASIMEVYSGFSGDILAIIRWVFVVPLEAQSFKLELSGGESFVLDSLLAE